MKRSYYRRGRLVEVEQVDGVLAVQGSPAATRSRRSFGKSARPDIRAAAPEIDEDALDAFAAADWQLVSPNASTRRAMNRGSTPQAADGVGTVVVGEGGRVGIASDLLNVQLTADLSADEAERVLDGRRTHRGHPTAFRAEPVRGPHPTRRRPRRLGGAQRQPAIRLRRAVAGRAHPAAVHARPTPATTTSGSGTTPAPAAVRSGPTCTSNRPGTTPSAPASGSPSSTTASTPTTRTWPPVSAPASAFFAAGSGGGAATFTVGTAGHARQQPRHLLRRHGRRPPAVTATAVSAPPRTAS